MLPGQVPVSVGPVSHGGLCPGLDRVGERRGVVGVEGSLEPGVLFRREIILAELLGHDFLVRSPVDMNVHHRDVAGLLRWPAEDSDGSSVGIRGDSEVPDLDGLVVDDGDGLVGTDERVHEQTGRVACPGVARQAEVSLGAGGRGGEGDEGGRLDAVVPWELFFARWEDVHRLPLVPRPRRGHRLYAVDGQAAVDELGHEFRHSGSDGTPAVDVGVADEYGAAISGLETVESVLVDHRLEHVVEQHAVLVGPGERFRRGEGFRRGGDVFRGGERLLGNRFVRGLLRLRRSFVRGAPGAVFRSELPGELPGGLFPSRVVGRRDQIAEGPQQIVHSCAGFVVLLGGRLLVVERDAQFRPCLCGVVLFSGVPDRFVAEFAQCLLVRVGQFCDRCLSLAP